MPKHVILFCTGEGPGTSKLIPCWIMDLVPLYLFIYFLFDVETATCNIDLDLDMFFSMSLE